MAQEPQGMFLCQREYLVDIIDECALLEAKPMAFPIEENHKLAKAS